MARDRHYKEKMKTRSELIGRKVTFDLIFKARPEEPINVEGIIIGIDIHPKHTICCVVYCKIHKPDPMLGFIFPIPKGLESTEEETRWIELKQLKLSKHRLTNEEMMTHHWRIVRFAGRELSLEGTK